MLVRRMEIQTVHKVGHDKLGRLVELHLVHHLALRASFFTLGRADASIALLSLTHHLAHTVQTRALGTEYRIFAFFRSLPEGCLQFGALTVGNVEHAFRLPNLAAAHLLHAFGEDDLVARLCHQLDDLIDEGVLHRCLLRESHRLVDATWEIDHFQRLVLFLLMRNRTLDDELGEVRFLRLALLLWHGRCP